MESNFSFLKLDSDWKELFDRSHKSEKYAKSDERASFMYTRMALELIVDFIYEYEGLGNQNDKLFNKTESRSFTSLITSDLKRKIDEIRKNGNDAAHNEPLRKERSEVIIKYLFDFSKWFFGEYSETDDEIHDEFNPEILNEYYNSKTYSKEQLLELEKTLKLENQEIISKYKTRISSLEKEVEEKDLTLERYESIIIEIEKENNLLKLELEGYHSPYKILDVGITVQVGKIWGRVFINLQIKGKLYYAVKFFSPNHIGRATERFVINSGKYQKSHLFQLFNTSNDNLLEKDVLSGRYDHLDLVLNYNKERFGTPSILLNKLISDIDKYLDVSSEKIEGKNRGFDEVLNFKRYYSAGAIEQGIHGPEVSNNKLYISIYHYLEYLGLTPRNYNTLALGNYLTSISANDYKTCKYKTQSFYIKKFNLDLLIGKESVFEDYKKK